MESQGWPERRRLGQIFTSWANSARCKGSSDPMCHRIAVARERTLPHLSYWRVELGARVTALVLVFMVSAITGTLSNRPWQFALLCLLAAACLLPVRNQMLRRWRPLAEAALVSLLICTSDPYDPSLLPYLVVPSLSAGLVGGWSMAVITSGATGLVLMSRGLVVPDGLAGSNYLVDITQWTLLALGLGLLAAWLRRVQSQRPSDDESYGEAARLITQLRDLSRELSGGLDVVSIAAGHLAELRDSGLADRAWIFSYKGTGLPVLLAADPSSGSTIDPDLQPNPIWTRAIEMLEPQTGRDSLT